MYGINRDNRDTSNLCILSSNTLKSFFHLFFFLFLYDGKHTSLSLPIFDPIIERTTLLNSSLISFILLSMVPTKVAAAGFSHTKLWFRMWSIDWITFFCTSFNVSELFTTADNLVALSILLWNVSIAGDRNKPVSLIDSGFHAKDVTFETSFFWCLSEVFLTQHLYLLHLNCLILNCHH